MEHWAEEDWTTSDGRVAIRDGKTTRYLPKAVWNELTPAEKRETNRLKVEGSKDDEQFVENPEHVREILARTRDHGE